MFDGHFCVGYAEGRMYSYRGFLVRESISNQVLTKVGEFLEKKISNILDI